MELRYWLVHDNVNLIAFVDTVRIKSADLKNKFLFKGPAAFCSSLM